MEDTPGNGDRIIVALDTSSLDAARRLIETLDDRINFYKIGYQLGYAGGFSLIPELTQAGKKVFLDLKLHDIGNTVARGVESLLPLGPRFLTVHAYPQTLAAAADVSRGTQTTILGVSVLTSMSDADLADAGYATTSADLVLHRARQAVAAGVGGLVCSPWEVSAIREATGHDLVLVTPGVRPAGAAADDQQRVATPEESIRAGADYLVIGRPISASGDPAGVAAQITDEIARAL